MKRRIIKRSLPQASYLNNIRVAINEIYSCKLLKENGYVILYRNKKGELITHFIQSLNETKKILNKIQSL